MTTKTKKAPAPRQPAAKTKTSAATPTPNVGTVPEGPKDPGVMQPAMDTAPVFKMTAVYHIFQQAWEQNGGKRTGFTAAQINDLLVADGGKTK